MLFRSGWVAHVPAETGVNGPVRRVPISTVWSPIGAPEGDTQVKVTPRSIGAAAGRPGVVGRTITVNDAVTDFAASTVTVQVPVPEHPPPDHPVNDEPVSGVAVRVRVEPWFAVTVQVVPQLMPAGLELTVPRPLPVRVMVTG